VRRMWWVLVVLVVVAVLGGLAAVRSEAWRAVDGREACDGTVEGGLLRCDEEQERWDGGGGALKDDGGASIIFGRSPAFEVLLEATEPLPKPVE